MSNYPTTSKMLAVFSKGDGPWVPVSRMREVEVRDATKDDLVEIRFTEHSLTTDPEPIRIRGSGTRHLNFPKGKVCVRRLAGKTPITVIALCERLHTNESSTLRRRSTVGHSRA